MGKNNFHIVAQLVGISGVAFFLACAMVLSANAYPVEGYKDTGIRRLLWLEGLVESGEIKKNVPPGGRKSMADIKLRLVDSGPRQLPDIDSVLQKKIDLLFPDLDSSYGLALLSFDSKGTAHFAERKSDILYSPGSVGKLAIAAGLFTELARLFPDSVEKRRDLLRNRMVTAGAWIHTDHHDVPLFDPATSSFFKRPIQEGDIFSLFEWTDHMLSASANAAASTVWKELILMRHFGALYPPDSAEEKKFWTTAEKQQLRDLAMEVVNGPLRQVGISQEHWQLGSLFTKTGKSMVPSGGKSYASAKGLLRFLLALENGRIVDTWSSLEIKRLMYMTAKRIRYASSPALAGDAVYFKSGSLYRCIPEPEFKCVKYKGNAENYMNSMAIVEKADGRFYLVVLVSNVLRKNSAVDHQTLATEIDRILNEGP